MTFDDIRKNGLLLYEYIRGSHMYGTNIEGVSDIDTGGVYLCPPNQLLGLGFDYQEQISDDKSDNVWHEFNRFIKLIIKSNPNMLEALFAPMDCIIGDVHPIMQTLIDNREEFITKDCFKPLFGYAVSQIEKARGLNKKIVQPMVERKTPLDFCYTFHKQGSIPMVTWLENIGLNQKFCGLVKIPNMPNMYGVYYDWASAVLHDENMRDFELWCDTYGHAQTLNGVMWPWCGMRIQTWLKDYAEVLGYSGIVKEDGTSNELRFIQDEHTDDEVMLNSVSKDDTPLCFMSYNKDGYISHCRKYREYKEWEEKRNPIRYAQNLNKNYDSKNMSHCVRLIHMAIEIARGEGFNVRRTWDRDFLLDIRNHKIEYDDLMKYVMDKKAEMDSLIKVSTIKDKVDVNFVNDLVLKIRKEQLTTFKI